MRARACTSVVGVAVAALAAGARAEPWRASFEAGAELDSNVRRVEQRPDGPAPEAAPLVRAQGEVARRDGDGALRWRVQGLLGTRAVVASDVDGEDYLTAALDLGVERDGPGDDVALLARATHYDVLPTGTVTETRAFASSGADLGVRLRGEGGRSATLTAGARRLRFKPDPDFDWVGLAAAVGYADELWRGAGDEQLELRAGYRVERRGYQGRAFVDGCAPGEPPAPSCFVPTAAPRADLHHVLGLDLTYTGARVLALGYQLTGNTSSSFGSSFVRHRVSLAATTAAPAGTFVTASVVAQVERYRDPLLVARDVGALTFESIDDENRSALSLRLARPLSARWQLELRGALYANLFGEGDRAFRRALGYAGLTWEQGSGRGP